MKGQGQTEKSHTMSKVVGNSVLFQNQFSIGGFSGTSAGTSKQFDGKEPPVLDKSTLYFRNLQFCSFLKDEADEIPPFVSLSRAYVSLRVFSSIPHCTFSAPISRFPGLDFAEQLNLRRNH